MTPEQAVKYAADRLSRRFFWLTLTILGVAWGLFAAAILTASWHLAGLGALALLPAAGSAIISAAFHSPRLRKDTLKRITPKT